MLAESFNSSASCALILGLTLGDFYSYCCRPERLREPDIKNRSQERPGPNAGIARERQGNPWCWKSLGLPSFDHFVERCCDFVYEGLVAHGGRPVRFLPFKSATLQLDLQPFFREPLVLQQRQLLGWSYLMAGYSGVLWPGSLVLSRHFAKTSIKEASSSFGRCIELAAGFFALPSLVLASRCGAMLATDLPGVVDPELRRRHSELTGVANLDAASLDFCELAQVEEFGHFDLIVSSEGVLQSPCGAQALLRLSTKGTELHLTLRGDAAEVQQQRFLLRNAFVEKSRVDLQKAGKVQPSYPPRPPLEYVVWIRIAGPRTCWDEEFGAACCEHSTDACFDGTYTRLECCGASELPKIWLKSLPSESDL